MTSANQNTTPWADEHVDRLRELHKAGDSFSVIARKLNEAFGTRFFTRCSCTGKAHRLKLGPRLISIFEKKAKPQRERNYQPGGFPKGWKKTPFQIRPIEQSNHVDEGPYGPGITLFMLSDSVCHWPTVEIGTAKFLFCGHAVAVGPYCFHHYCLGTASR